MRGASYTVHRDTEFFDYDYDDNDDYDYDDDHDYDFTESSVSLCTK